MNPLLYIKIAVFLLIASSIGFFVYDYNMTKKNLEISIKNEKKLNETLTSKETEIESLRKNLKFIQKANSEISNNNVHLSQELKILEDKFKRKDKKSFEELSVLKPKLIESIINKASSNTLRCLEKLSGAKGVQYETIKCN